MRCIAFEGDAPQIPQSCQPCLQRHAVTHHHEGLAAFGAEFGTEPGGDALPGLAQGLASAPTEVAPGGPPSVLVGEPALGFRSGEALPGAHIHLLQHGVRVQFHPQPAGDGRCSVGSPAKVTGEDPGAAQAGPADRQSQRGGAISGLSGSHLVQRRISAALESAGRIPRCPAVPYDDQKAGGQLNTSCEGRGSA